VNHRHRKVQAPWSLAMHTGTLKTVGQVVRRPNDSCCMNYSSLVAVAAAAGVELR